MSQTNALFPFTINHGGNKNQPCELESNFISLTRSSKWHDICLTHFHFIANFCLCFVCVVDIDYAECTCNLKPTFNGFFFFATTFFLAANIYYHLIAFNISTLNHVKIIITFVRSFPLTISSFIFQINFHTCSTL